MRAEVQPPAAEWVRVSKQYASGGPYAVRDVSFAVEPGEIVVIVGPNGSGKTTLMEMVSGLRRPTSGDVRVNGETVVPLGRHRLAVGVQLQEAGLPQRITVKEAVAAVACLYADPGPVHDLVQALGLRPFWRSMVETLSGGWQRRLDVALAFIGNPDLVILDEPTSGLDPVARAELWEFLRRRRSEGVGILASTHDLSEAEAFADRLMVMNRGRLVLTGSVGSVMTAAGGEWRLRLLGADASADEFAAARGLTWTVTGESRTLIDSKEAILALTDAVETAHTAGQLTYQDLLRGPVRLEDVFAITTREDHTDVAA